MTRMRHTYPIYIALFLWLMVSCRQDETDPQLFLDPQELHLTYGEKGVSIPYESPLQVVLTNVSEQLTYTRQSDQWGYVVLDSLLPGEYTVNVSGELSAHEMQELTGDAEAKAANLVAFMQDMVFCIGKPLPLDELKLTASTSSALILQELYYAGSRTPSQGTYRNDGFYTVYNNSPFSVNLNHLYIGNTEHFGSLGTAGPLWPGEEQGNYKHVYMHTLWKVTPDDRDVMLEAGQRIVIAVMGAPHNQDALYNLNSPVDLSDADYEAYCIDPENTYVDFPAKNMKLAFWPDYGYLWRISVFGQGMALLNMTEEEFEQTQTVTLPETFQDPFESDEYWLCRQIPIRYVVDAVDLIQNSTSTVTKRFPPSLDCGYATVGATYQGLSVRRKVKGRENGIVIYQDTNNSTEDFEINPNPLAL